jgi:hypothetical protein
MLRGDGGISSAEADPTGSVLGSLTCMVREAASDFGGSFCGIFSGGDCAAFGAAVGGGAEVVAAGEAVAGLEFAFFGVDAGLFCAFDEAVA